MDSHYSIQVAGYRADVGDLVHGGYGIRRAGLQEEGDFVDF